MIGITDTNISDPNLLNNSLVDSVYYIYWSHLKARVSPTLVMETKFRVLLLWSMTDCNVEHWV